MSEQFHLLFIQKFKGKILFGEDMKKYTSIKIGGPAEVMAFPRGDSDLKDLLTFARTKKFPFYILGGGTNLLVRDGGIKGLVVNMTEGFGDINWQKGGAKKTVTAIVGAGAGLQTLVNECTERGLTGLEFACSIPGTVGGAVMMNAGAYGGEMADVVDAVEVINDKGKRGFLSKSELDFSYRSANIPDAAVVVRVHMKFDVSTTEEVKGNVEKFREKRKRTAAIKYPSAGSVFKNPPGEIAGKLIQMAELKGTVEGRAMISEVHGNYIVNLGGARARDVLKLMSLMRDRIYSLKGIALEPEIKVVGEQ